MVTTGTQTFESRLNMVTSASVQTSPQVRSTGTQVNKPVLTYEDFKEDDNKVAFFTGFPNKQCFDTFWSEIENDNQLSFTNRTVLRPIVEFLLFLMRLRLGLLLGDLAVRFCVSESPCTQIFSKWLDYVYSTLGTITFLR